MSSEVKLDTDDLIELQEAVAKIDHFMQSKFIQSSSHIENDAETRNEAQELLNDLRETADPVFRDIINLDED